MVNKIANATVHLFNGEVEVSAIGIDRTLELIVMNGYQILVRDVMIGYRIPEQNAMIGCVGITDAMGIAPEIVTRTVHTNQETRGDDYHHRHLRNR